MRPVRFDASLLKSPRFEQKIGYGSHRAMDKSPAAT